MAFIDLSTYQSVIIDKIEAYLQQTNENFKKFSFKNMNLSYQHIWNLQIGVEQPFTVEGEVHVTKTNNQGTPNVKLWAKLTFCFSSINDVEFVCTTATVNV